jgi:hypothetical protein
MITDGELIASYHSAAFDHDSAKAGSGIRVEAFAALLVAERLLAARLGWEVTQDLKRFRERYSP